MDDNLIQSFQVISMVMSIFNHSLIVLMNPKRLGRRKFLFLSLEPFKVPSSKLERHKGDSVLYHQDLGSVAQSVERPSKVPVWCNSPDVGSNHERDIFPSDHAAV